MRNTLFTIIVLSSILCLSGCAQEREINDLAIFSGIAVETAGAPPEWSVTGEVVNEYQNDSGETQTALVDGKGPTLTEALAHCSYGDARESHWGHASAVIVGPELAEAGISPLLRHFTDNYQYRISMDLLLSGGPDPAAVWSLSSNASQVVAYDLSEMLVRSREISAAAPVKLYQALEILETDGIDLTVPIVMEDENGNAVLSGAGIFWEDRQIGVLSQDELLPFLLLQNKTEEAVISLPSGKGSAKLQGCRTRLEFYPDRDPLALTVSIQGHLLFTEMSENAVAFTAGALLGEEGDPAAAFEEAVSLRCAELVRRIQSRMYSDIFGFGLALSKTDPHLWSKLSPHWNQQYFPTLAVTVLCDFEVSQ